MHDAGLRGVAMVSGARLVFSYAVGFAQLDLVGPGEDRAVVSPMESLPANAYPRVVAAARETRGRTLDDQFELGLRPLLLGPAALAAEQVRA
ncbi:hypothetical protein GCM10011581_06190 [Saccharopolyspora subtropica]|uniref:Uncharacterized protein n=1 Tax=Saccharopolyspora thermophila TaxID=89367 RepID=A0A917N6Q0_9PSEU|nr:hypothetical protein [Saccharopolyspora subtropica]GGI72013.1 hypothetical protein GCM10011581_06190 [Saccharopolyspora subtropica]